jgi:hypothetical protein
LKVTPQEVTASYEGLRLPGRQENLNMLDGPDARLVTTARQLESTMLSQSLLRQQVGTDELFTALFLK